MSPTQGMAELESIDRTAQPSRAQPSRRRPTPAWHRPTLTMLVAASLWPAPGAAQAGGAPADSGRSAAADAMAAFFSAESVDERRAAADGVLAAGLPLPDLVTALRRGRPYRADVPTGRVDRSRDDAGRIFRWFALVPESYDPARAYPVRFYLHGGVSRPAPADGDTWWRNPERVAGPDHVAVFPASWSGAFWWTAPQVRNLHAILGELKHSYNVDESRVSVTGVSDGGTGVYFLAVRDVTPWSAFLPFIGHAGVLLNPAVQADGPFHLANVVNTPLYVINGTDDRLYPVSVVEPFVDGFRKLGAEVVWRPQAGGGHDTRWWPAEAAGIERFLESHPRDAHPERVVWETERVDRYARAHWVRVDSLGSVPDETDFRDGVVLDEGVEEGGRVEVVRAGNDITVRTRGVRRITLLLSPDALDLSAPVSVTINGREAFRGPVAQDPRTLLEWAALDDDRTRLYTAALTLDVAPG